MATPVLHHSDVNGISTTSTTIIPWGRVFCIAIWFGVLTGLLEGCGLLVFQNLNQTVLELRVSSPIIWISPVVDVLFFSLLALIIGAVSFLYRRINPVQTAVTLLSSLSVYDFLTLTARLSSRSRVLLAIGVGFAVYRWVAKREGKVWHFCKRTVGGLVVAAVLVFVGVQGGRWFSESRAIANLPLSAPGSPNVLVIVVDTLRADHLSSYGYAHSTTSNMDALAREGALFENAISDCSWTYPSHVSLVTGRHQFEHEKSAFALSPLFALHPNIFNGYPTIGEALQQRGYRTAAFSANQLFFAGNLGFSQGFIHFEDYFNSIPDMFSRTLVGREFLRLYGKAAKGRLTNRILSYGVHNGFRKQPSEINDELLSWIDKTGPRPFFAFVNYFSAHAPYGLPDAAQTVPHGTAQDTALYDQGVEYTDHYIGLLLEALKQKKLDTNTLVILTADHGESLGEHDLPTHGRVLYWEQIHVPLIIWFPGHVPAGTRIAQPVSNVNIAATIMDLTGANGSGFSGPALNWAWQPGRNAIWPAPISELAQDTRIFKDDLVLDKRLATAQTGAMKSLVTSQWHLIVHKTFGEQLYDWGHDPTESNNLIATPQGQQVAGRLLADLASELNGLPVAQNAATVAQADNKYYRVKAKSGEKLDISVKAANAKVQFDPVITIENLAGVMYQTCRNVSDDNIPAPGISDPTPQAFDDMCIDGGVEPNGATISGLEILVPGNPGSPAELQVRIDNWNGHRIKNSDYLITVIPKAE